MKKTISLILALALCIGVAVPVLAAERAGGKCGGNVSWSLGSDGVLTVSGTGAMENFVIRTDDMGMILDLNIPWYPYKDAITSVVIRDGVTTIGDNAFFACSELSDIRFPNNITYIGAGAFEGCWQLRAFSIPDSVTAIGDAAFYASGISKLTIPDSVTDLGAGLFGQSAIAQLTLPEGLKTIGTSMFYMCYRLERFVIPEGVTAIGDLAFFNASIQSVSIPASVTSIGDLAFAMCYDLRHIYYGGTEAQWNAITKGTGWDAREGMGDPSAKLDYTVHFSAPTEISVTVNGKPVVWTDVKPFIDENDRTMVPLRAVADAMGLEVDWDGDARVASFSNGGKTIYFPIDSSTARGSDGQSVRMDTAAVIVSDRTYAPIRYLAEYFGYTVGWNGETRTVSLS